MTRKLFKIRQTSYFEKSHHKCSFPYKNYLSVWSEDIFFFANVWFYQNSKFKFSIKNFQVVIPHSTTRNNVSSIKKEYLASTIEPKNTFATMCESTLQEIYDQCNTLKTIDVFIIFCSIFGNNEKFNLFLRTMWRT